MAVRQQEEEKNVQNYFEVMLRKTLTQQLRQTKCREAVHIAYRSKIAKSLLLLREMGKKHKQSVNKSLFSSSIYEAHASISSIT